MTKMQKDNLKPLAHVAQNRCFGCGHANAQGLQLEFLLAEDGTVVCPTMVADSFEGHPGYLHGGIIATLLDETMSKAVRARGLTAMTRHLEVDYKRPVPSSHSDTHGGSRGAQRRTQALGRSEDHGRRRLRTGFGQGLVRRGQGQIAGRALITSIAQAS